jgi:hypothetical protein
MCVIGRTRDLRVRSEDLAIARLQSEYPRHERKRLLFQKRTMYFAILRHKHNSMHHTV